MNIEIFGIIGSILILASISFKNILYLRVFNLVGSIFFVVYGALISAWSTIVLNAVTILINIFYIIKELKLKISKEKKKC